MGLFDILKETLESGATELIEMKWREMSTSELTDEWEQKIGYNDDFEDDEMNIYKNPNKSYLIKLDEIYASRTYSDNWYRRWKNYEEEKRARIAEELAEEKARLAEEKEIEDFKKKLSNNKFVDEVIKKANELAYEAYYIEVFEDCIEIQDEDEEIIFSLKYKKFEYPDLNDLQMEGMLQYLQENLKLHYEENEDNYYLELMDSPEGMKESW